MNRKLKKGISLLLGSAMLLSFAGCGSGAKTEQAPSQTSEGETETNSPALEPSKEPVTIRFSWWGGDDRHKATLEAIEAFEKKYPNITVECEYGGWSGWQEKITTQMVGKQEADLMQINWNWLYLFSQDGQGFYDLEQLSDYINLENYPQEALDSMTVGGVLNGVPVSTSGRIFAYNSATYEKAGVEIPQSLEDLYKAAEVFQEKLGPDYYPLAGDRYTYTLLWKYYLEQKYGKEWIVDNKLNYTQEELADGFNFMLDLEAKHVIPSLRDIAAGGSQDAVENDPKWLDGRYAGTYDWDSAILKWQEPLAEGELILGGFPTDIGEYKSGLTKVSQGFAISKNTKHPVEAAMLLDFLVSDEEAVKILGLTRGIVSNKAAEATLEKEGLLTGITYEGNQLVNEYAGFGLDPNFEATELRDDLYKALMVEVSYGETTPEDAAAKIIKTVNEYNESYPVN